MEKYFSFCFFYVSREYIDSSSSVYCVSVIARNIRNDRTQVCSFSGSSEVCVVGDSTRRFINVMLASNSWLTPVLKHTAVLSPLNVKFNVDLAVCIRVLGKQKKTDHPNEHFCCLPVENKGVEGCVANPSELPT